MWKFSFGALALRVLFGFFVLLGLFVFVVGLSLAFTRPENLSVWHTVFDWIVPFIGFVFSFCSLFVFSRIEVWKHVEVSLDK